MVDESFMRRALELAAVAEERGDVPVGAVLVRDGEIAAVGFNQIAQLPVTFVFAAFHSGP